MEIIDYILEAIKSVKNDKTILVAFDGVDNAGKTVLADKLFETMKSQNIFSPVRISIDKFHNPKEIRLHQGELSPEGFFNDSFNYKNIIENVIMPVKSNNDYLISGVFDYKTESTINEIKIPISKDTVVLFDGIFMNRDELYKYWDISIFLDVTFETVLKRALARDVKLFGFEKEVIKKYNHQYIPGEKIYLNKCKPKERADIVIDNNNYYNPKVMKKWSKVDHI